MSEAIADLGCWPPAREPGNAPALYKFLMRHKRNSHRIFTSRDLIERRSELFRKGTIMLDILVLAVGIGFFGLSIGYAIACGRF